MMIDIEDFPRYRVISKQQLEKLGIKCGKYFHKHAWRLGGWMEHYAVEEDWLEDRIAIYKRHLAYENPMAYADQLIVKLVDKAKL